MTCPDHLTSACAQTMACRDPWCHDAVKVAPTGRWFITMGHAGFNSPANNGAGYMSPLQCRTLMAALLGRSYWE